MKKSKAFRHILFESILKSAQKMDTHSKHIDHLKKKNDRIIPTRASNKTLQKRPKIIQYNKKIFHTAIGELSDF